MHVRDHGRLVVSVTAVAALAVAAPTLAQSEKVQVDSGDSYVVAVTHSEGVLGFLGHEHAVMPTQMNAEVCFNAKEPERSEVSFTIPARTLRIDTPEGRKLGNLEGSGPDKDDRQEIQRKMVGSQYFAVDRFPTLSFKAESIVAQAGNTFLVKGPLTIRGVTRNVEVPVEVDQQGGRVVMDGHFDVLMTNFGMEPESVAGVVDVANNVDIYVHLEGRTSGSC